MLISVLFVLCLGAALAAGAMHNRAKRHVEHIPAAFKIVRQGANYYPVIVMLYGVLWLAGTNLDGVLPAFGPMTMVSFIVTSLVLGRENLRYARQYPPAFR
jgi:hypothetical protein